MIVDSAGNLYGTTAHGGPSDQGVVFELIPNAGRTSWKYKLLHAFCSLGGADCLDGAGPEGRLTYHGASSGAPYDGVSPLYGVAAGGGALNRNDGVVYSLTPGPGRRWTQTVLHVFCQKTNCSDGANPDISPTLDGSGNLFGSTIHGSGFGVVYKLDAGTWAFSVPHAFCAAQLCDGPAGPVTIDAAGNLFAPVGRGPTGHGGLIELSPSGAGWTYIKLHDFCGTQGCPDGSDPAGNLIIDSSGNLFGTATRWGPAGKAQAGDVFEWNGSLQVLQGFCLTSLCRDGKGPMGPLTMDANGSIFGTTLHGGPNREPLEGGGTVFELTPD